MKDGLYFDLKIENYLEEPGIRYGDLVAAADCLARYKWKTDNSDDESGSWAEFGQAFHLRVLEPERFSTRVATSPKFDRRTKQGKEDAAAWEDQNLGKIIISSDDHGQVEGMGRAVEESRQAQLVLKDAKTEISVFWTDPVTHLPCKCRLDAFLEAQNLVVELKGVRSAKRGFMSQLIDCGWHRQAAWQMEGLLANNRKIEHVVFIAVEKEPPHLLTVAEIEPANLAVARMSNAGLVKRISTAQELGVFPGYDQFIEMLALPEWAQKQLENTL